MEMTRGDSMMERRKHETAGRVLDLLDEAKTRGNVQEGMDRLEWRQYGHFPSS